ncbi:hypothetical protein NU10_08860 [Flavobacterium dauae]|uniref:hypothetical protein n=1 Tax=Flavobacterium dauae TaxID=1563479 RepID=UPI00101B4BD2|nr:hypothetical protein [Flavobacterium dauae]WLD22834.1 hypothetical protein NU10_08860 [Flavobacterium dauae]
MNRKELKQQVLTALNCQIVNIQNQITALAEDAQNDAKSSAGDKYETSLAMMHLAQEKLNNKLSQLLQLEHSAKQLPEEKTLNKVTLGSVVKTNYAVFYISVPIQSFVYQNKTIICVSVQAPLIQQILNKEIHSEINFNNLTYKILEIF